MSYAEPPSPVSPEQLAAASAREPLQQGVPPPLELLPPPLPRKPWQLLWPGADFDPATAPEGATVRDQASLYPTCNLEPQL